MKRNALGKGLSALLPDPEPHAQPSPESPAPLEVPIDALEPNPVQPRLHMDPGALAELASSIQESGMVQPILVRSVEPGRYQIIAGERRWRAAQKLGLERVPITLRDVPDDRLLELALVENIQRQELTPIEEARAYQNLLDALAVTQEELARKVGKDRSTIANGLRLLRLPTEVQDLVNEKKLDAGHVRPLLALERAQDQVSLAREAIRKGFSAREVERQVASQRAAQPVPASKADRKDANTRAAEEQLRAVLGTRVDIKRRTRGGALEISFANEAELNRLFDWLIRRSRG